MPGSLSHLSRRFFDVLRARPLLDSERAEVVGWLTEPEQSLFFAQSSGDQRHGHTAGLTVVAAGVNDPIVIKAALLHDVGKRHARLGVVGRVLASLLILLRLPLSGRFLAYRDHGKIAAEELERIGAEPIVIEFAREHHGKRPSEIDVRTWDLLQQADEPPKTWAWRSPGIS